MICSNWQRGALARILLRGSPAAAGATGGAAGKRQEDPVGTLASRAMGAAVPLSSRAAGVGGDSWSGPNVVNLAVVAGVALLTCLIWAVRT